jgi:hypothetical protein
MNQFNKKNYKGSHEMYNDRSYLGTDKIQTYKNTCVGRIAFEKCIFLKNEIQFDKFDGFYLMDHILN